MNCASQIKSNDGNKEPKSKVTEVQHGELLPAILMTTSKRDSRLQKDPVEIGSK